MVRAERWDETTEEHFHFLMLTALAFVFGCLSLITGTAAIVAAAMDWNRLAFSFLGLMAVQVGFMLLTTATADRRKERAKAEGHW